jgi:hypothetical protein
MIVVGLCSYPFSPKRPTRLCYDLRNEEITCGLFGKHFELRDAASVEEKEKINTRKTAHHFYSNNARYKVES